ncbi:MAG: D-aminoacyl-tRNA deacylase [Thermoplasmata archaeon]
MAPTLIVVSEADPVASRVVGRWGTPPSAGEFVDGTALRQLAPGVTMLRRPGLHIHDEHLDRKLPSNVRDAGTTLVFPSIHRGEQNVRCLTVHPLGNLGSSSEVGGRARAVVPTDPRRMASALRLLSEGGRPLGLGATFEATHHGPELGLPSFFVEIGYGTDSEPPPEAVRLLADVIPTIEPDPADIVALAVGGGHYAPHFTDLALRRRWAFGHIVSRHALADLDRPTAESLYRATPEAVGIVYARAADADHPLLQGLAPRARESAAPTRERSNAPVTPGDYSTSGT